jgi:hypothetical protein
MIIKCLIAVILVHPSGKQVLEHTWVRGKLVKSDPAGTNYMVNFEDEFKRLHLHKDNIWIQWVHGNECLFGE